MTSSHRRHGLKGIASRFAARALALSTASACAFAGYQLHEIVANNRLSQLIDQTGSVFAGSGGGLFAVNSLVTMTLLPALIIGALSLGGIYLWNRHAG